LVLNKPPFQYMCNRCGHYVTIKPWQEPFFREEKLEVEIL